MKEIQIELVRDLIFFKLFIFYRRGKINEMSLN